MGVDRESISAAYHDVRDDNTPNCWLVDKQAIGDIGKGFCGVKPTYLAPKICTVILTGRQSNTKTMDL